MVKKGYVAILCFAIVMLQLINFGSALEFDNIKSYDDVTREVTIKNAFGLGETIGKARLNTPLHVYVPAGKNRKVAEFDLSAYQDYNDVLKEISFKDMKQDKKEIVKNYELKYLVREQVEVADYDTKCFKEYNKKNETYDNICEQIVVGYHYEEKTSWEKISPADLKKNDVLTIGVFTDVELGEYVDWIPKMFGVDVDEWATYEGTGGTITYDGNYTVHTFTENGTFGWTQDDLNATILVVAGGGGGGKDLGGAGGAGGLIYEVNYTLSSGNYDVVVGTGGTGSTSTSNNGNNGQNSSFGTDLNALGGGGGASRSGGATSTGGSGGGGSYNNANGGSGLSGQGFDGGDSATPSLGCGGGGGASEVGSSASGNSGGEGGDGLQYSINGTAVYYAGGGGGATGGGSTPIISGGLGGGGLGGADSVPPTDGTDGLGGGGGGGGGGADGGDGGDGVVIVRYLTAIPDSPPTITLNDPTVDANYSTSPQSFTFNFSASDEENLDSVKLYVNDILNQTNASGVNDTYYYFDLDLGDGSWEIYGVATDNESQTTQSASVNFVIDSTPPTLNISGFEDLTTYSLPINSTWDFYASDVHIDDCYFNTTDHATEVVTCNTTIETQWATEGNKTIVACANDTFGNQNCSTSYVYIYSLSTEQADNPDPVVAGFNTTFNLTVNLTNIPTTTATLVLNNTEYSPTTTIAGANGYFFEVNAQIPESWGNITGITHDWFWNYTIDGVVTNVTETTNITAYELAIDDCSTYGEVILDFSLLDEESATLVNESNGATVEIDLALVSKENSSVAIVFNKTWTDESNPQVCLPNNVLNNSQFWIDFTVGFDSTDHVWEFYYLDDGTLNSSKVFNAQTDYTIDLMDLLTDDSTSFLFNYFDQDGLPVEDAMVHVFRKYIGEGTFREVERAKSDLNGDTIVHLVEEDVIYYFLVTQYGVPLFTSSTYTALCQATPCTIQIEASGGSASFPTDWDLIDGGAYTITSTASSRVVNFSYTANESKTMNLTIFKYNSDGSYSPITSNQTTGTNGEILLTVPQSAGNVSFFATVYDDGSFINSEWVDFEGKAQDRFGVTLALFIGFLIILTLGLMAVTEGVGTLVMVLLGVALSGFLGLMTLELSTGVNVVVYLIIAGGILLWKLTGGRR